MVTSYLHPTKGRCSGPDSQTESDPDDPNQTEPHSLIQKRYGRDVDVAEIYGVHRSTIWRWVREKIIPPPIRSAGSTRFDLQLTDEAIAREAAKNAAA